MVTGIFVENGGGGKFPLHQSFRSVLKLFYMENRDPLHMPRPFKLLFCPKLFPGMVPAGMIPKVPLKKDLPF